MELMKSQSNIHQDALLTKAGDDSILILTFRIGTQLYGLPVSVVVEIVRLPALVSLAGAPHGVIGLLNLRGAYLPIFDGSILIDETPVYDINNQIIIAGQMSNNTIHPLFGLRVDQVFDVLLLHLNRLTPLSSSLAAPFLKGVIEAEQQSVLLFDIDELLVMIPQDIRASTAMTEDTL